jgi:internalin A
MSKIKQDLLVSPFRRNPEIEVAKERISNALQNGHLELDLAELGLTSLPDELFKLSQLEKLNLLGNPLITLSEEISTLINLKEITLSEFQFKSLPQSFSVLSKLESITLSSRKITQFPELLLDLKNLTSLNLSGCNLTELPDSINELNKLEILWLLDNPIKDLSNIKKLLSHINSLSILRTKIKNFSFLNELTEIRNLSIGNSFFYQFPSEVFTLKSLWRLHIAGSNFVEFPDLFNELENLEYLLIYDCPILERLPESICTLQELKELCVVSSHLISIPTSIYKLGKLEVLRLNQNHLNSLPESLGKLSNLNTIDLSHNKIHSIPSELGNLKKLHSLNLSFNEIVTIPTELSGLINLKEFNLRGNYNLVSPSILTISNGTEAIISYLRDLVEEIKVWSSKLVIVGEGQVGKSCLLDSLKGQPFHSGKPTTHALNRAELLLKHPVQDQTMKLNVWDFGGQDIYHATHQFYLTNHSLFLLVWSARAGYEAGKLYKWLETINALAPDSPIFIVATNAEKRGADLPKGDIINNYPGKIFFFNIDNENQKGIAELKEAIQIQASHLKYMGIGRPKSWMNSSAQIPKISQQYISKENLFSIFHRHGVSKESYESLASYLHDLGQILYYPDEDELNDTIITKPEWVSKQIAKILDSEKLSLNHGFLDNKLLKELWYDLNSVMQNKLITLMEKFDLSYKTKDDKAISLIVEKLTYEEHKDYKEIWDSFDAGNEIAFKYQLDTIPAGIPTWFIARTHRFSIKVHWRFGVLLKDSSGDHLAQIITSPERKEIWLRVKGVNPYYFFAQLRDTLELTFNRFEGLSKPAYVPCPGHRGQACTHFFELKQLEKRLSIMPPKNTIECPEGLLDIDVMKLIFGLSFAPNNQFLVEQIRSEIEKVIIQQTQTQTEELKKFTQLEFIKSFQTQQEIADQTCPNVFTLIRIRNQQQIEIDDTYSLQLYCQMPGCNHPTGNPYKIKVSKEWIRNIAPYYNKLLKIFKYTLPIAIPFSKSFLEETEFINTKLGIESIKDYSKIAEDFKPIDLIENQDFSIREIRTLLDKVDPSSKWNGLKRLVSPEGYILWLCAQHYSEYKK